MIGRSFRTIVRHVASRIGLGSTREGSAAEPRVAADERIYAIGDPHGRADLFAALLARIEADEEALRRTGRDEGRRSTIVVLGDCIDRGEESAEVLAQLRALTERRRTVALMGNHEAMLLAFLEDPEGGRQWLDHGGLQTLASYGVPLPSDREAGSYRRAADGLAAAMGPDLSFLRSGLALMHRSGNVVFVHAAFDPTRAVEEQDPATLLWGSADFVRGPLRSPHFVVHGHYAGETVRREGARLGIDTGAYYSGTLTAVRLDSGVTTLQT